MRNTPLSQIAFPWAAIAANTRWAAISIALILAGCATTPTTAKAQAKAGKAGDHMRVRTTAYTPNERGGGGTCNACGQRLHFGGTDNTYSAGSDWAWLPLGTRFKIAETGRTYVIEDYGSAIVGKKTIDLFMPSRAAMFAWGTRYVNIDILEWGSTAMSLKLLEPRQKAGYVRRMVAEMKQRQFETHEAGLLAND